MEVLCRLHAVGPARKRPRSLDPNVALGALWHTHGNADRPREPSGVVTEAQQYADREAVAGECLQREDHHRLRLVYPRSLLRMFPDGSCILRFRGTRPMDGSIGASGADGVVGFATGAGGGRVSPLNEDHCHGSCQAVASILSLLESHIRGSACQRGLYLDGLMVNAC